MIPFQYLEGCGSLAYPYLLPDVPGVGIFLDVMPLVEPAWGFFDYYQDSFAHYKSHFDLMGLTFPLPVVSLNGSNFAEYKFTIDNLTAQDVYGLTTGYLHFLPQGRSSPLLENAIADTDMLILEPLRASKVTWRWFHSELAPTLQTVVYRNVVLNIDSLKKQIEIYLNEPFFQDLYRNIKGVEYVGPPDWIEAYWDLFMNYPEVSLLVQGGAILGTTTVDLSTSATTQRLNLFFNIDGWSGNEASVKKFFYFRNRLPGLEGHPMIALLTGQSVEAGYIDYIQPLDLEKPWQGRGKEYLHRLPEPFNEVLPYHAIAIDPDTAITTLIIQQPLMEGFDISELPLDHGITGFMLQNPMKQLLTIDGFDPNEVVIEQLSLSETEALFTFQATPASPDELMLSFTANDPHTNTLSELFDLNLVFLACKRLPIQFHQLSDLFSGGTRTVNIDAQELTEMLGFTNYIIGSQANVYCSSIMDEQNVVLQPLHFDEDLGMSFDVGDEGGVVDMICNQIWLSPSTADCHVIFMWDLFLGDIRLNGYTKIPPSPTLKPIILLFVPFQNPLVIPGKKDLSAIGATLIHELGHWISLHFLFNATSWCTGGQEHFGHDACFNGDTTLYLNMMAPGESLNKGRLISLNQARIYNQYADQIQPQ
ncbi:MAG: hypothetical protein V4714_10885 [Bacteroidota bacterium]